MSSIKRNRSKNKQAENESTSIENVNSLEGGLKVAKPVYKSTIQEEINKDLLERIPISAFLQEKIQVMVKNTVGIKCRKCGSEDVFCESKQLRSADEATTKIYTCLNCGNRWRVD